MENLLVPRNLEGRKEKRKHMNIRLLSQEVVDGNLVLDESFMDIDAKFVKLKKVNGSVTLDGEQWTEIPSWLKDISVEKNFICSFNKLVSLKNCPQQIGGGFYCTFNRLTSLKGCPQKIGGIFYCYDNFLTSLEGCPENIICSFNCSNNKLTSLDGCPKFIGGDLYCHSNKVKLELPDYIKIGRVFKN